MSGHTSWNLLKRIPRLGRATNRVIWVEGYVSALEDVVKGLEHQRATLTLGDRPDNVLDRTLDHVQSVLATAQDVLRQLQAIQKEAPYDQP